MENKEKQDKKDEFTECNPQENSCEQELKIIKEKFQEVQEKYKLPAFKQLNADFDISKIEGDAETILRDIRKLMVGKFSSWLTFVETLLNPTNGSMFHMYLVKSIGEKERKILSEIFSELGEIEIQAIEYEINYKEEKEAEFIKNNFKKWQGMKKPLEKILASLKSSWKKESSKKEKTYLG